MPPKIGKRQARAIEPTPTAGASRDRFATASRDTASGISAVSAPAKSVERPYRAAPEIARLEQQWWDENAPLVAKVWELHDEVSHVVRRCYLQRARLFLSPVATTTM